MTKNKNNEVSIHILVWLILFFLPAAFSLGSDRNWVQLVLRFSIQNFVLAGVFYCNYLLLIPKFYSSKKSIFFLLNIVLIVVLIVLKQYVSELIFFEKPRISSARRSGYSFRYIIEFLISSIPIAFAIAINSGKKIQQAEEIKREAETIKLQSELQHLKYQLQPHFFFNSLNTIYSLIDFDPEKAKQSIHSLSKLMRHLLYKSDVEQISLSEEIDFLNKYIDLMSLRLNENTKVITEFPTEIPTVKIAPLLLISIVENAFKHGVSATENSKIQFKIKVIGDELIFSASNANFPKANSDKSGSGIGVENVKKRLNLLYPNNHSYTYTLENGIYTTIVKLNTKYHA